MTTTQSTSTPAESSVGDLEEFMETDARLQDAYMNAITEIGSSWTDEQLAEAAFQLLYGGSVDDLMQAWRWKQTLANPNAPDHSKAWDVHEAVQRWNAKQAAAHV